MSEKLYRFIFDKQTGLYKGLTYEQPWADNTTVLQPHFAAGFKTVFDFDFSAWKLVPQESFFKQMSCIDDVRNVVELKNDFVSKEILNIEKWMSARFDVIDSKAEYNRLKILTEIYINKSEIILNRQQMQFLKTEILFLQNQNRIILDHVEFVDDLLIEVRDAQKDHYLYSRKFYWTSRFIDSVTKFAMRSRDIFFKFFNS